MLADTLQKLLADVFTLYFKAHSYHWNVEGSDFAQYHDFLGDLYEEVHGSVDNIAELIRTLNVYAPPSLASLMSYSSIEENDTVPDAKTMLLNLRNDNDRVLAVLYQAYDMAEKESSLGISNNLQDRIEAHEKHAWMLRSITK
jgi:starvation-inducible DNA-binding protein